MDIVGKCIILHALCFGKARGVRLDIQKVPEMKHFRNFEALLDEISAWRIKRRLAPIARNGTKPVLLPTCCLRIAAQGYAGQPVGNIFSSVQHYFKTLLTRHIPPVDVVITMGCNVQCPMLPSSHREDWGLDDPTGKDDAAFLEIIRLIEEKVLLLRSRFIENYAE